MILYNIKKWFNIHIDLIVNLGKAILGMFSVWLMYNIWIKDYFHLREVLVAVVGLVAACLWTELDKPLKKKIDSRNFYWETHVKLAQIGYAVANNKFHEYEFKMEFGNFIHLCGIAPKDSQFSKLFTGFQYAEECLIPIFITQHRTYIDSDGIQIVSILPVLNYPRNDDPAWVNFKFAFENLSKYVADKIYVDPIEFKMYSSPDEYILSHRLQETCTQFFTKNTLQLKVSKKAETAIEPHADQCTKL